MLIYQVHVVFTQEKQTLFNHFCNITFYENVLRYCKETKETNGTKWAN